MNVLTGVNGKQQQEEKLNGLQDKKIVISNTSQAGASLLEAFKVEFSEKYLKQDGALGELQQKLLRVEQEVKQERDEEQVRKSAIQNAKDVFENQFSKKYLEQNEELNALRQEVFRLREQGS